MNTVFSSLNQELNYLVTSSIFVAILSEKSFEDIIETLMFRKLFFDLFLLILRWKIYSKSVACSEDQKVIPIQMKIDYANDVQEYIFVINTYLLGELSELKIQQW